ncbi:MAG: DUF6049 family protein [Schumannella sp.]
MRTARASTLGFHAGAAGSLGALVPLTWARALVPAALVAGLVASAAPATASPADPLAVPAPVSVAVVVPLTVPVGTTGLLDAETLTEYTSEGGLLDRELDAVSGTLAAVALDPMIPVSIRVLGSSAPAEAVAFLDRLRLIPNQLFLLGYADADPALAAEAGIPLTPLGFSFAIDPADFGPAQTATPVPEDTPGPSETPDPGEPPPLPTTEELLDWATSLPAIAWPAEGTVAAEGLAGLAAQGYTHVLLAESNASASTSARAALGDLEAVIADDELTAAVRAAAYASSTTGYEAAALQLSAVLRDAAAAAPGRTLVATLDRDWPEAEPRLAQVLATVSTSPDAAMTTLSAVLAGPRSSVTLTEPSTEDPRPAALARIGEAAAAETTYLRIADDPAALTQPRRLSLLALAGAGWSGDTAGWSRAAEELLTDTRATLDAVQIVAGSDQLVLSDISSLRIQVSNALPAAVTVSLQVRPLRPLLHVDDPSVQVTVEPDSTATAAVGVQAITNGDVSVRAELRDSVGAAVGSPRVLRVILQAGWETAGTLIAGALVVIVFGAGIVRTVLRRRSGIASGDEADATDADG